MERRRISFTLLGDIHHNSRALRQIGALLDHGFFVEAIGFGKKSPRHQIHDGFAATTLPMPQSRGIRFFFEAHRRLSAELNQHVSDHYHASDLYTLPASHSAANKNNRHVTYDSRELYTHVEALNTSPIKSIIWKQIERRFIGRCQEVYTVSDSIADFLADTYSIPRPTVVYNAPDMSTQKPSTVDFRKIVPNPKDLIVVHNGQVRKGRGCENLAAAFKYLPASSLVFMGNGPLLQTILDRAELEGYRDRIHALDPVPPNQVIAATATADLGATMLEDSCLNHRFALPNKLFEYASAGIPVLGSDLPEISSKIKSANIGTTVNPDSTQAISQKLTEIERNRHLIDDWKSNTLSFSETFSWKKASEAFLQYFQ